MKTLEINHVKKQTNYTGLEDGAEPVHVYRKAKFVVVHVGEPVTDTYFNSSQFRTVKFVEVGSTEVFTNQLYDGHYSRLAETLTEGNIVEIDYQVGDNWIRTIDGKRWN